MLFPSYCSPRMSSLIDILVALSILMGYSVTTASFVTYVVREHQTKSKQLQHISGIGVTCYWVTNFIYDMVSNVIQYRKCRATRVETISFIFEMLLFLDCSDYCHSNTSRGKRRQISWDFLLFSSLLFQSNSAFYVHSKHFQE